MGHRSRSFVKRKTPYHRIVENSELGKGVRLSPQEVSDMVMDDAIMTVGERDLEMWERKDKRYGQR